jgi:hypothetical protein
VGGPALLQPAVELLPTPAPTPLPFPWATPVAEYSHSFGCSVTGGYRYRGFQSLTLVGVYFFADYCSGRIWSLQHLGPDQWQMDLILDYAGSITSFGVDGGLHHGLGGDPPHPRGDHRDALADPDAGHADADADATLTPTPSATLTPARPRRRPRRPARCRARRRRGTRRS